MKYIILDKQKEIVTCGTDVLLWVDGRLNNTTKAILAGQHVKRLKQVNPELHEKAYYIARYIYHCNNYPNRIPIIRST